MYKSITLLSAAFLATATLPVYADDTQPLPGLSDYYASPAPKPPLGARVKNSVGYLSGLYVTAKYGKSHVKVSGFQNVTQEAGQPPVTTDSASKTVNVWGANLGYQLRESGIFSRIALEYTNWSGLNYNPSPVLSYSVPDAPTVTLNSSIKSQALLLKTYYDFNFDTPFIPYLDVGVGMARNQMTSSGTFQLHPLPVIRSNYSIARTELAGGAGVGLRFAANKHVLADLGYEFDWLGGNRLETQIKTANQNLPITIKSSKLYTNTLALGLTLQL